VIVTLIEEEIRVYEGVPIVPVLKLNGFINELDTWKDDTLFCFFEEDLPLPDDETEMPLGG